jgi:hypothetical protein
VILELATGVTFERRMVGVTNNGAVHANRNGAVACIERQEPRKRGVVRMRFNIGVEGDRTMVRRFGCMMKRKREGNWMKGKCFICEQTSAELIVWMFVMVLGLGFGSGEVVERDNVDDDDFDSDDIPDRIKFQFGQFIRFGRYRSKYGTKGRNRYMYSVTSN